MIFIPKKKKYKKEQKGRSLQKLVPFIGLNNLTFGSYGLKCVSFGRINSKQIRAMYQAIRKIIKKNGRIILKVFAHMPISKKPIEVRMGKGKGNIDHWVARIKSGTVLCEIDTKIPSLAFRALNIARYKIPIKTKIFCSI